MRFLYTHQQHEVAAQLKWASFLRAEPFQFCAAPPVTLGFEDATPGVASNPLIYNGFNFSANTPTGLSGASSVEVVNAGTEEFPAISSGFQALESTFTQFDGATSQQLKLSITAGIGPFVAVSGYINGLNTNGISGITVNFQATSTGYPLNCGFQSFPANTPGNAANAAPLKVLFATAPNSCAVDTISLTTDNSFAGSGIVDVKLSLDDFVVCKANTTRLQGALP